MIKIVSKTTNILQKYGTNEEIQILNRKIRYTQILTILFWTSALITGNLMCINSFVHSFMYEPKFTFDPSKNVSTRIANEPHILRSWFPVADQWKYYYFKYSVQFYIMWVGMIIVPCWHSFIVALMIFAVILLMILNHKIENIDKYIKNERKRMEKPAKNGLLRSKFLKKCIEEQRFITAWVTFEVIN